MSFSVGDKVIIHTNNNGDEESIGWCYSGFRTRADLRGAKATILEVFDEARFDGKISKGDKSVNCRLIISFNTNLFPDLNDVSQSTREFEFPFSKLSKVQECNLDKYGVTPPQFHQTRCLN